MTDENESAPPARPPRRVSRAPAPPPRIDPSCTPREPKQKKPAASDLNEGTAEHPAAPKNAVTSEQEIALNHLAVGKTLVRAIAIAKVLRQVAHLLETWPLPDTQLVRTVRGLVQLTNDAFAFVENRQVSPTQGAIVGNFSRNALAGHHSPEVCADFQMRSMSQLAEGKRPRTTYFANPVEEVANDVINEQKAKQQCARAAPDRVVSVPPCAVDTEGFVPFSWAVYWMVPKEIIDSKASIKVQEWEVNRSKLVSWIGSKKVTLIGRRPGNGENQPLPPELLANQSVVDWVFDLPCILDGPPWPNTPFLQCCYCPDDEHWQRGHHFNDQFFNAKHRVEWTHLQVNMAEVVAASKTFTPEREPSSAALPEVGTIVNLLSTQNANWTAPARLEIVGWSPPTLSIAPGPVRRGEVLRSAEPDAPARTATTAVGEITEKPQREFGSREGVQVAKRKKGAHAREAALKAIREVYGDKIPDQSTVRNGPFCNAVRAKLPPDLAPPPDKGGMHNETILRAAGRKK